MFIFLYECYWPIPDYDREKFSRYVDRVVPDNKIPKEELIYFGITDKEKLKLYKQNRPKLNIKEQKIISKYKHWLNVEKQ